MKKFTILTLLIFAVSSLLLQGCQSQNEQEEAAQREKLRKWGKDFTPEKYRESQEKPKKPYWRN